MHVIFRLTYMSLTAYKLFFDFSLTVVNKKQPETT